MGLAGIGFAASAAAGGWVLAGYPLALAALPARPWTTDDATPSVTIVVRTFREREALRAKLEARASDTTPSEAVTPPSGGDVLPLRRAQ